MDVLPEDESCYSKRWNVSSLSTKSEYQGWGLQLKKRQRATDSPSGWGPRVPFVLGAGLRPDVGLQGGVGEIMSHSIGKPLKGLKRI